MSGTQGSRPGPLDPTRLLSGAHGALTSVVPASPVLRRALRRRALAWAAVVLAAAVVLHVVRRADAERDAWRPAAPVAVVARAVRRGEPVPAGAIVRRRLPRVAVPTAAMDAVPAGARAAVDLAPGQVLTRALVDVGRHGAVAAALPAGDVAVAVTTGDVRPVFSVGDRVDVVAVAVAVGRRGSDSPLGAEDGGDGAAAGGDGAATTLARGVRVLVVRGELVTLGVPAARATALAAASLGGPVALVVVG